MLPNTDANATLLGAAQWAWLEEQLHEPAQVRIIGSSIQVVNETSGGEKWSNFPAEKKKLFELLWANRATGVIFISGDRHYAELEMMDGEIGYPVYDLTSSSLNWAEPRWRRIAPSKHRIGLAERGDNFGLVEIDWNRTDPLIRLKVIDVDGRPRPAPEGRSLDAAGREPGVVAGRKIARRLAGAVLAALAAVGSVGSVAQAAEGEVVLVLFHGCHEGASSADWKPLRDALPPGFTVVAPELPKIEAEGDNTAWMAAWRQHGTATVDRAFAEARKQNPKAFLMAGGAGCGGFFALIGAERHDVDARASRCPGLSDEAQRARLTARRTPVLGIASKDDRDVPARVEAIVRAGGEGSVLKIYPGSAHGTAILTGDKAAPGDVRRWIVERTGRALATPRPRG